MDWRGKTNPNGVLAIRAAGGLRCLGDPLLQPVGSLPVSKLMHAGLIALAICVATPCLAQSIRANGEVVGPAASFDALMAGARDATIVHLVGGAAEHSEAFHRARFEIIRRLHEEAGYGVLVMPVGIFEGWWVDRQLEESELPETLAAWPLYRIWLESPGVGQLMEYLRKTRSSGGGVSLIGSLSRFHARGKELYAPHLLASFESLGEADLPREIRDDVERLWAGRDRLSRATPELRQEALDLAPRVLALIDANRVQLDAAKGKERVEFERQFVLNMSTFVQLEQIRAGDLIVDQAEFSRRESAVNLSWFLETAFPQTKLIVWEGLGDTVNDLDVDVPVFRVDLSLEQ